MKKHPMMSLFLVLCGLPLCLWGLTLLGGKLFGIRELRPNNKKVAELHDQYLFLLMNYASHELSVFDIKTRKISPFKMPDDLGEQVSLTGVNENLIVTVNSLRSNLRVYDVNARKHVYALDKNGIGMNNEWDGRGGFFFTVNNALMHHDLMTSKTGKVAKVILSPFKDFGVDRKKQRIIFSQLNQSKLVSADWDGGRVTDLGINIKAQRHIVYNPRVSPDGMYFSYNYNEEVNIVEDGTRRARKIPDAYYHYWSPDGKLVCTCEVIRSSNWLVRQIESFNRMSLPIYLWPFEIYVYSPKLEWKLKVAEFGGDLGRGSCMLYILPREWPATQFLLRGNAASRERKGLSLRNLVWNEGRRCLPGPAASTNTA